MLLFLLDPLWKLGGVVAHWFLERNFEFERNLLTSFIQNLTLQLHQSARTSKSIEHRLGAACHIVLQKKNTVSIKQKYWKEWITYLLRSPSGNGIRIRLDKYFWTGVVQRLCHNCLDFFVGNLHIVLIKLPFLDKQPRHSLALETALAGWGGIE